jgi:hypothetical protein
MKLYRFSPIKSEEQLLEAIRHIHFACYELCNKVFNEFLPNAGNVGIFCHYEDEFEFLTKIRQKMTEESQNFNQKYFRLHQPIVISAKDGVPETKYEFLYIRKPDPYRYQVGDIDFYLPEDRYAQLKKSPPKGARVFDRQDLDMVELFNPDIDVLAYVSTVKMTEIVRIKQ